MRKLLFIFNPFSGKAQIKNRLLEIVDTMVKAGYEVTIYPTQSGGDAADKTEHASDEYELLVVSGGDGTLDEAVDGMMRRKQKIPIGYIPAGSTNDFAVSLNIPKDMGKAAYTAVNGVPFLCDVGAFGEKHFVYVAAFGIFTGVSYSTSQERKNLLGHVAYLLEGVKSLHEISSYRVRAEYDNIRLEDEFMLGMITNSTSVGGFKGMTGKDVRLDDGVFEVTLIKKPRNPLELNRIIQSLRQKVESTDMVYSFKTDHICFYSEVSIPWTLDGEYGGSHNEVEIQNICKSVEIIIPPQDSIS